MITQFFSVIEKEDITEPVVQPFLVAQQRLVFLPQAIPVNIQDIFVKGEDVIHPLFYNCLRWLLQFLLCHCMPLCSN